MVSLENMGQNLFFQSQAICIATKAEFFLPWLLTAGRAGKSSLLAGVWPFSPARLVLLGAVTARWFPAAP